MNFQRKEGETKNLPFPTHDTMIHSPEKSKGEPRLKRKKRMDRRRNACNETEIKMG